MSVVQLPVHADYSHYEFKTVLDGIKYGFVLRWNTRAGYWILDIKSSDETVLLSGIPLLIGVDLLAICQYADIPQGKLFLVNLESEYTECGRDDLGENVLLMYQEAS